MCKESRVETPTGIRIILLSNCWRLFSIWRHTTSWFIFNRRMGCAVILPFLTNILATDGGVLPQFPHLWNTDNPKSCCLLQSAVVCSLKHKMFYTVSDVIAPQESLSAEQVLLKYNLKPQEGKGKYKGIFSSSAAFAASTARGLSLASSHLLFLLQLKWPVWKKISL